MERKQKILQEKVTRKGNKKRLLYYTSSILLHKSEQLIEILSYLKI